MKCKYGCNIGMVWIIAYFITIIFSTIIPTATIILIVSLFFIVPMCVEFKKKIMCLNLLDIIKKNPNIFVHIVCFIISCFAFYALLVDGGIMNGCIESENATGWNKILATLGGSFIAGYIFYIITTTIFNWVEEQKKKEKKKKQNEFVIKRYKLLHSEIIVLINPVIDGLFRYFDKGDYYDISISVKKNFSEYFIPHIHKKIDAILVFHQYLNEEQLNLLYKIKDICDFHITDLLINNPACKSYLNLLKRDCDELMNLNSKFINSFNE